MKIQRWLVVAGLVLTMGVGVAHAQDTNKDKPKDPKPSTRSSARPPAASKIIELQIGNGAEAKAGQKVSVHYSGLGRTARSSTPPWIAASPSISSSARAKSSRAGTRAWLG